MVKRRSLYATCAVLEEMLGEGWRIEPPVYVRPHWRSNSSSAAKSTYHFVLWRDRQVNLISVPESPEIQQFLAESEVTVDSL
jgi:hypothetical protein